MWQQKNASQDSKFILDYEPGLWGGFFEFRDELEGTLSTSLTRESAHSLHATTLYPWLEVILIFTSTTVATTFITKIGGDIYEHFKTKIINKSTETLTERENLVKRLEKLKTQRDFPKEFLESFRLGIKIKVNKTLLIEGKCRCDSYESVIDALNSMPQMFTDALQDKKKEFEKIDNYTPEELKHISEDEVIILKSETQRDIRISSPKKPILTYTYDMSKKQWMRQNKSK